MIKVIIVGCGNVGLCAAKAVELSPDMELCGFVRRRAESPGEFPNVPAETEAESLPEKPDGAIICLPSRQVPAAAKHLLSLGISTADAFDIHGELRGLREELDAAAKKTGARAVTGAGWDPGLDSSVRALLEAAFPVGTTYTDFGPGMSMGHSAAVKEKNGIEDAVSVTIPLGFGKHRREVYAVLKTGADKNALEHGILSDEYFEHDETKVSFVPDAGRYKNTGHAVKIGRGGASAGRGGQNVLFRMSIDNPAVTGQLLVGALRAAMRQKPGCYLFPQLPPADMLPDFFGGSFSDIV